MRGRITRGLLVGLALVASGCSSLCPCCDWCKPRSSDAWKNEGPPPPQVPPPNTVVPSVGPGAGAYGGS